MANTVDLFKRWMKLGHAKKQCQTCNDLYFGFVAGYREERKRKENRLMELEREKEKLLDIIAQLTKA